MKLTLTADWTAPTPTSVRIAIGGYTAAVQTVAWHDRLGQPMDVYEFTILLDHIEIVEVGQRDTLDAAKQAVEVIIALHAQARQEAAV